MLKVQKIQQNTILKNDEVDAFLSTLFKKYNKIQSLRTFQSAFAAPLCSKNTTKYNP